MTISASELLGRLTAGQALSARRVDQLLTGLSGLAGSGGPAATIYLPAENLSKLETGSFETGFRVDPSWRVALEEAGDRAARSPTGLAAFRIGDVGMAVQPPFPMHHAVLTDGINADLLRSLLAARFTVGVALVRLGRYAIAVYEGEQLAVSKTDTRYVKGKHHAGGTSQRRFQRVRENQIHRLYAEASDVLERQWRPWLDRLDYVALGGEAATVNGFVKECPLLTRLAPITLKRRLDVREPNRAALDRLGPRLYQCRVYPLRWDA